MFREMTDADLEFANDLLKRINHSAADVFNKSYINGTIRKKFVYEKDGNRGVFTIVKGNLFYSLQLSFEHDVSEYEDIKFIEAEFMDTLSIREREDIYVNFNGYNAALINYFMECGLERDSCGFEFHITADSEKVKMLKDFTVRQGLTVKRYEEEHIIRYLKLLDEAFRKQQIECGEEQDVFSRNHEEKTVWLKGLSENNNFQAFWLENQLVGLYIVNENYLDIIAVHPDYEGKGYGSEILKYCVRDRVYEHEFDEVYLVTYYQNRKAQRLYLRNGFKIRGFYCENTYKNKQSEA